MNEESKNMNAIFRMNRRTFVKVAGAATGAVALGAGLRSAYGQLTEFPDTNCGIQEFQPYVTSPFIMEPFREDNQLPQPLAMAPGWRRVDGTLDPAALDAWTVRRSRFPDGNSHGAGVVVPGPGLHQQDVYGHLMPGDTVSNGTFPGLVQTVEVEHLGTHQIWPVPGLGPNAAKFSRLINWPTAGVPPILYHIRYQVGLHSFTSSPVKVLVTDSLGIHKAGAIVTKLPDSLIYGFNGTFPGPMINVEYGKPALVRFENDLDKLPAGLKDADRQDFGAPDFAVLTHLHNGHTAAESDGQPHYMQINGGGYTPGDWYDNLYLNYPAGGDPNEIQSFLWFHDHRMHFTGANVYKGQVGLMPHYDPGMPDPKNPGHIIPGTGLDTGNESDPAPNLKLPGVRTNNLDGTFDVKYDIPMAFFDCALDDGATPHLDMHSPIGDCPAGKAHPEWWGRTFFKHWPNHGFVGDIFTVNCKAYPVLHVSPRRYRFRFLGASVSRIYELCFMTSGKGPVAMPGTQGQWQIPDGKQWKPMTRIASMGGLLPKAIDTPTVHIWPASRREVVVDFSNAKKGDVIYLTNVLQMKDGREPAFNDLTKSIDTLPYKVPMVKIVVDLPSVPDNSAVIVDGTPLRPMPAIPNAAGLAALPHKEFILSRGGPDVESQWVINSLPFDALVPLTTVFRDQPEVWINKNGGGGWVHPMHMHMEEHTTLARVGSTLAFHPDDTGKEDVTNLEPSESVTFYRNFRTFTGRYVAHCHNLAHEDHNMMFGWSILEPVAGTFAASGKVVDNTGNALSGVLMTLTDSASPPNVVGQTSTDGEGNYSIAGLAKGDYTLAPTKVDFAFAPTSIAVIIDSANVTVPNFVGTMTGATGAISGKVFGKNGKTPLSGVTVTLAGGANMVTTTDMAGSYSFAGLANGFYTVRPSKGDFKFQSTTELVIRDHAEVTITGGAQVTGINFKRV